MLRPSLTLLAALLLAIGGRPAPAQTAPAPEPLVAVPAAVPPPGLLRRAHFLGRQAPDAPVSLALTLPLRNQGALHDLLHRLYDRADPAYGQYLTAAQFDQQFTPAPADTQAVADFAQAHGLTARVCGAVVGVTGASGAVEDAFGVHLNRYRTPDGRVAYANDSAPQVPASIAARLDGIVGLDTLIQPKSHIAHPSAARLLANAGGLPFANAAPGSGPVGGFSPSDIKAVYSLSGLGLTGAGQTLGLLELDGYNVSDIARYNTQFGLGANLSSVLSNIPVAGYSGTVGGGQGEVVLDIDMMLALAPRAQKIYVYEADDTVANGLMVENQIATDDLAQSVSDSWGSAETSVEAGGTAAVYGAYFNAENAAFQRMAAQGQSFFVASGDNGAYTDGTTLSVDDPASQPYVTGVGGTDLTVTGGGTPQIAYQSEAAWGFPGDTRTSAKGAGSGGGPSIVYSKPPYQFTNPTATPPAGPLGFSATARDVPDVSLFGDYDTGGYDIFVAAEAPNGFETVAGTSAAAPLWAAFTALVNEARAVGGTSVPTGATPAPPASPLGFANPVIYEIGTGQYGHYAQDFHDVTAGNNLFYNAGVGYDDATGWGSFNGINLLVDLAASSNTGFVNPLTHTFPAGLQMISAPFDFSRLGTDFAGIFALAPVPASEDLITYQSIRNSYVYYPTAPADTLRPGLGYWLRAPAGSGAPLARYGTLVTAPFSVSLQVGWNQIGDPFISAEPFGAITVTRTGEATSGPLTTAKLLAYPILYTYAAGATAYATETSQLQPFAGYWLYAFAPITLTFNDPTLLQSGG